MRRIIVACFALLIVISVISGCATIDRWSGRDDTSKSKSDLPNQVFYGFPDIPIPTELTYETDKSFIYETQTMRVGILVLSGNVEPQSVEDYFKVNMAKNGWRFVNSFKFRGDISANFTKDEKTVALKVSRTPFTTEVEIWVGPAASFDRGNLQRHDGPAKVQ
ncbi:MAG: hypothetical protein LBQ00_03675 [Syntrophobacterales bacterium]|jgi:hypothetical protein|nr:hypothetical protein [Syntrophobacterales bacterium]